MLLHERIEMNIGDYTKSRFNLSAAWHEQRIGQAAAEYSSPAA